MNRDEAKQLLPIFQAFAEGKAIQYGSDKLGWTTIDEASFRPDEYFSYRIKPEPKLRPWTEKEAPRVFAARNKESGHYCLIDHGKDWHTGDVVRWDVLCEGWSRIMEDGTSQPCGVLEAQP